MAAALVLEASVFGRVGSSPTTRTFQGSDILLVIKLTGDKAG